MLDEGVCVDRRTSLYLKHSVLAQREKDPLFTFIYFIYFYSSKAGQDVSLFMPG